MEFTGFTQATSDFLWDLAFHNERPWFLEHKEQFLTVLKEPFDALGRETLEQVRARWPDRPWQLHVSRIYRDARRLFGRGPYKDHLWLTIWDGADRRDSPAFWFELGAASYEYGVGFWGAGPDEMEAYRAYIREHPQPVEKLARRLNRQSLFHLVGEEFKRPKGDVGALLNPWYNRKWIGLDAEFDFGGELFSPDLPKLLAERIEFLMPYYDFFCRFRIQPEENWSDK